MTTAKKKNSTNPAKKADPTDELLTEQDREDIASLNPNGPIDHTLLEIWRNVLGNIEASRDEKIPPTIANKIANAWPKLSFPDVQEYHELYHAILIEARDILDQVIRDTPNAFKHIGEPGSEDADAVANRAAYIELLFQWQLLTIRHEAAWHTTDPDAHIKIAAIADAAGFITGEQGLVQHLGQQQIGFQFTEEDQNSLAERLGEARAEL